MLFILNKRQMDLSALNQVTVYMIEGWLVAEAGFESHFQNHFVKHEVILFYPHDNLEAGTRAVSILQEGNGLSKVEGPAQES